MNPFSLTDLATLRHLLAKRGLTPQRSAGQNFLICAPPIEAALAALDPTCPYVTELGAGIGPLTHALLQAQFHVRAIERDRNLAALHRDLILPEWRPRHTLLEEDLRTAPWEWEEPYQIVGNIPYNLSGFVIRRLCTLAPAPLRVVLMVQQEVALRLKATPPTMSLLSLAAQDWAQVKLLQKVPPTCFWPAPRVTSQLVVLTPHAQTKDSRARREAVLAFAKPFFQTKRKQMGSRLKTLFGDDKERMNRALEQIGHTPEARPQELKLEDWHALYDEVSNTPPI